MTHGRVTRARAFAIVGLGLAILGAAAAVVVRLAAPVPIVGAFGFNEITLIGYLIAGLTWASIGALLVTRRPENTIGWLMVIVGVGYALSQCSVSLTFAFAAEGTAEGDRDAQIAGWATVLLQLVTVLQLAIGFLFPTGRVQSARWGWFMRFFWSVVFVFVVISLTQPGPLQLIPGVQNPFGLGPDLRGGRPIAPILVLATLVIFASLVISMVTRYRSSGPVERQQMKWFVLSLGISSIGLAIVTTEVVILNHPDDTSGLAVYVFAGALVPVAIGIAILRNGLYDIDRIISRTISYAALTAILAAMFTVVVLVVSAVLTVVTRGLLPSSEGESIAVAVSTLVVFTLFQPIRTRIQRAVDRRFDRARYDGEQTIAAFAGRLRSDLDLASISADVTRTADAAMHPVSSSVWLRRASR
jgi:hypothetical protein